MFQTVQKAIDFIKNSTNVRQITIPLKHKLIRTKFQILSKMSLTWAAKQGMELFFCTHRYKRPEREHKLLQNATERFTFNWRGKELPAWAWGAGPTILLVHGWNGRGAQLGSFIAPLVDAGYRVVTYDAPGHGDSSGHQASLVDLSESISAAVDQLGQVVGVIAHSLGAAATTLMLTEGKQIPWVVYIAPPLQPRDYVHKFAKFLRVSPQVTSLMVALMSIHFHRSWESLDIPTLVKSLDTSLLVIHDQEDKDVFLSEGVALVKAWPSAELIVTQGLGHRRILHQKEVIKQVLAFIETQQSQLTELVTSQTYESREVLTNRFSAKRCNQEGCKNLILETLDNTGYKCSSCLIDAELFNPALRWA
ncbi:MAG: hypothetical protein FD167_824 [bacterium]|nr:MAG: hypothetical protein FD167_824 [bacterium]